MDLKSFQRAEKVDILALVSIDWSLLSRASDIVKLLRCNYYIKTASNAVSHWREIGTVDC
jgi:hypothetical protein